MPKERRFEWDSRKAEKNKWKHGISFPLAMQVFGDILVEVEFEGDEHGETRWKAIGQVGRALIVVIYTTRDEEGVEVIRLIHAHKASRSERRAFEENS